MIALPTDKLNPGYILAEEVCDINGRLLLAKGNEIQKNHIRIFKIWGISEVKVVGPVHHSDQSNPEIDRERAGQVAESLELLFRHVDLAHPAIKEIFKLAIQFRYENYFTATESNIHIDEEELPLKDQKIDFIKTLNKKNIVLPEIPSIVFELNEVIANPMSSANHIAQVVNKSPSLTAVLLKIVNSSFYNFPSKIDTVSHAVALIGTREVTGIALGISVISIFNNIPKNIIDMYSFLKHSLACGILSRVLAAHKNFPHTEQMFISGLLHDLGRLILYVYFPQESRNILARSRIQDKLLYEVEKDYLGCDHAQVGRQLIQQWKLPLILENNVFYHHKPSDARQPIPATIVHLADIIVNSLGIGSSGEKFVPHLDYKAWENFELVPSSFKTLVWQAVHQFRSMESILHL